MDDRDSNLLKLMECPGLGPGAWLEALNCYKGPPPSSFWGRPETWYRQVQGLSERVAKALAAHVPRADPILPALRAVCRFDEVYPSVLTRLASPPPIIISYGNYANFRTSPKCAIVASADAGPDALEAVKRAAESAIEAGFVLVGGHNKPVYQRVMLAAKRNSARSVMVLDRGLLSAFDDELCRDPIPAARIWGYAFDTERSVAISPFRLRDGWVGPNSRRRDELVVALADTVVALGVREDGTMHRLSLQALARGQTVYADEASFALLSEAGALPWTGSF